MNAMRRTLILMLAAALAVVASPSAHACAVCFGKSDSDMAKGMNVGIFSLMLVILTVLGGAVAFFVSLARRAAAYNAAQERENAAINLNSVEPKPGLS